MSRSYFVCPDCGAEVDTSENIFCWNCGENLANYNWLEKVTEYESWEYCRNCDEPGYLSFGPYSEYKRDGDYVYKRRYVNCSHCGVRRIRGSWFLEPMPKTWRGGGPSVLD